ncbi:MAG: hypothetical protein JWM43_466 [Acidobacteriaceae bacterium]|nr:hypothetical protein [Acidobacteriaceae bacterium]
MSKNLSKYQTEFKAYMVSNSIVNSQGDKASYGQGCDGGPCILGFGVGQRQATPSTSCWQIQQMVTA